MKLERCTIEMVSLKFCENVMKTAYSLKVNRGVGEKNRKF